METKSLVFDVKAKPPATTHVVVIYCFMGYKLRVNKEQRN